MRGRDGTAWPDWLDIGMLNAVWLKLPGRSGSDPPRLRAAVRDGLPLSSVPSQCFFPGLVERLSLGGVRAPRAFAQAAPELRLSSCPEKLGTATTVLRSADGAQSFLLTCAHVAAPSLEGAFGAEVERRLRPDPLGARHRPH